MSLDHLDTSEREKTAKDRVPQEGFNPTGLSTGQRWVRVSLEKGS